MLHEIDTAWMVLTSFTDLIKKRSFQGFVETDMNLGFAPER